MSSTIDNPPEPDAPRGWVALRVTVPASAEDEFVGQLSRSSLGAEVTPLGDDRVEVSIFVANAGMAAQLLARAERLLHRWGLDRANCDPRVRHVADDRWVERYQAALEPFPLGARFRVYPAGAPTSEETRIPLTLVPGRAFGTGEHPTTRMCVEALERTVGPGSRWIDLGTGSGILTLVALHCGASRIEAIDNDPEAVAVAGEVLAANGLDHRVDLRCGSLPPRPLERADGLVCNISPPFFRTESQSIARAVRSGGWIVASGFSVEDGDGVARSLAAAGLREIERMRDGEWAALVMRVPEEA